MGSGVAVTAMGGGAGGLELALVGAGGGTFFAGGGATGDLEEGAGNVGGRVAEGGPTLALGALFDADGGPAGADRAAPEPPPMPG